MKSDIYYIKLYFDPKNILEKDILFFLDSLSKIKKIEFFFSFLNEIGLETIRKMKEIQKENSFEFNKGPIISNQEERVLIKNFHKGNKSVLLVVARNKDNIKNAIDNIIRVNGKLFHKIDKKITNIENVDIITPLNMRGDQDILELSFLLSKYAINLLNVKKDIGLKNFPNMFLGVALIFDLEKKFKTKRLLEKIIYDYFFYLLDYFRLDIKEKNSLEKVSKKYLKIIKKINNKEFSFQKDKRYLDIVNEVDKTIKKSNLLLRIKNKFKDKKNYWMFYHWFNNSLNVHFAQEIVLVFILKNFYEKER